MVPGRHAYALRLALRGLCFVVSVCAALAATSAPPPVDFNRDIRPILSDHCYACHGPDENKRKGGLRLDKQADAFKELKSGKHALVAGDPAKSTLVERILTADTEEVMPPPKTGKPLTKAQVELLQRWVQEGAKWKEHWSFLPPERAALPEVKDPRWGGNPVDRFVRDRLSKEGIQPGTEADKATLIRRARFDLTGLPPTIDEVDAFLADKSPDAYEKLVDRLMELPQYGERMTANWLDLARFADTSGYHFDGVRFM
jgi:mono/diheme cytochrome c family protein